MGGGLRPRGIAFPRGAIQSWGIDVAGAGEDELLDARLSGRSRQVLGTHQIHLTSLLGRSASEERGEVNHGLHPLQGHVHGLSPEQIPLHNLRSQFSKFLDVGPGTDEGPDLKTLGQKPRNEVRADLAGGARDENGF